MLKGFKNFIMRGNVVDLAVGIVIGAAFGKLIDQFVASFIAPIVAWILPGGSGLAQKNFTLFGEPFWYGAFIEALITFVATAAAIYFFVVVPLNKLNERRKTADVIEDPTNEEVMIALLERIASK